MFGCSFTQLSWRLLNIVSQVSCDSSFITCPGVSPIGAVDSSHTHFSELCVPSSFKHSTLQNHSRPQSSLPRDHGEKRALVYPRAKVVRLLHKLPPELRSQIYDYSFDGTEKVYVSSNPAGFAHAKCTERYQWWLHHPILDVDRRVLREARSVFFTRNVFDCLNMSEAIWFLSSIRSSGRSCIRRIGVALHNHDEWPAPRTDISVFVSLLHRCDGLQHLTIYLDVFCGFGINEVPRVHREVLSSGGYFRGIHVVALRQLRGLLSVTVKRLPEVQKWLEEAMLRPREDEAAEEVTK